MSTIVLCHGAWSAAWAWRRVRPLMHDAGHEFFAPTYTGLGARTHLAHPGIDLETHIADILAEIGTEELSDITLLAHSYGGLVATGVADRLRDRIARVIYLDAFVPTDGQSLFSVAPPAMQARMETAAAETGEGWRVPPNPSPPDTSPDDLAWIDKHRVAMPIACFRQKLALSADPACPRHFIYAQRNMPGDPFRPFLERAQREAGWTAHEIDASHSPNVTAPELLMETLAGILPARG